jgi:hypothetical protein
VSETGHICIDTPKTITLDNAHVYDFLIWFERAYSVVLQTLTRITQGYPAIASCYDAPIHSEYTLSVNIHEHTLLWLTPQRTAVQGIMRTFTSYTPQPDCTYNFDIFFDTTRNNKIHKIVYWILNPKYPGGANRGHIVKGTFDGYPLHHDDTRLHHRYYESASTLTNTIIR